MTDDTTTLELQWSETTTGVDWNEVEALFRGVLGNKSARHLQTVFEGSAFTCFARRGGVLVAAGRALADGADVSYLADIVVRPDLQGRGVGRDVVRRLMHASRGHKKIILYAAPGKQGFYSGLGFKRMNTAMAVFVDEAAAIANGTLSAD